MVFLQCSYKLCCLFHILRVQNEIHYNTCLLFSSTLLRFLFLYFLFSSFFLSVLLLKPFSYGRRENNSRLPLLQKNDGLSDSLSNYKNGKKEKTYCLYALVDFFHLIPIKSRRACITHQNIAREKKEYSMITSRVNYCNSLFHPSSVHLYFFI